jgi:hypothetical protein
MPILIISAVICTVLILAGSIIIINRQPKRQQGELMRLSETAFTAVMGGMMIALGFFILYAKYADPAVAGTDETSYIFVGCFAVMCAAGGCGIMLYTFLKKIIACEDRVLYVDILGQCRELHWSEITEIRLPLMSNKITLIGKSIRFVAGGEPKAYKEFVKIAKNKIRPEAAGDVFEKLSDRLLVN